MRKFFCPKGLLSLAFLGLYSLTSTAQVTLNVDAGQRGSTIGDRHYGIFFEEINHAGDGGLYAELIQNRSFEDDDASPIAWTAVGTANLQLVIDSLLNEAQSHALKVYFHESGDGLSNSGYWGISAVKGQTYKLSFWVKGQPSYEGTLTVSLQTASGTSLGSTDIPLNLSTEWTKVTAEIVATGEDSNAQFALTSSTAGTVVLDVVSLFPPTFKDRENGCRIDLAEKLAAMKPAFVRFPGGCYVEGVYNDNKNNRFEWKNTIGSIEQRAGHRNQNWGYNVTDGFGFHEMLQLTEDLGAEPLFVVNMGMGHAWYEDYTNIDDYIQEALDAIEYCNGDAQTTKWGALRAKNGHPEPFNLRLMEIGNENYNFYANNNNDQSDHYAERYEQFRKAINAKYPEVTLIGNVEAWGTDDPSWRNAYSVDAVDEHYYRNPSWFIKQYNKYDSYSRSNHKVYVGEYAVTSDFGTNGHLNAAIGEAVFMLGMENNADVCIMNSYAPIFVNENHENPWRPDMIRFNSAQSFGTPSYYVQQLFPNNVGKENVKWTEENNSENALSGTVGLSTWSTAATFDNVKLTASDGTVLFSDDFSSSKSEWTSNGGTWSVTDGALKQTSTSMQGKLYVCSVQPESSYTFEVDATKNSGAEGFLIAFNYVDENNYCWWNLGGWGNTSHAVEQCINGSKSTLASATGTLVTGQTYHIKVLVNGTHVQCYLDDALIHDFNLPVERKIYVSANINDETGVLYMKMVNPNSTTQSAQVNLTHATVTGGSAVVLTSTNGTDENTMEDPTNVSPKETTLSVTGQNFTYELPAYSVNILRLNVTDVEITSEQQADVLTPVVQYSFETETLTDDAAKYPVTLSGEAQIVTFEDGNKAAYTGSADGNGYLDLGSSVLPETFSQISGDYSISVDVAINKVGNLSSYCWLYGFAQSVEKSPKTYLGLVNSPNNGDWYFTIADTTIQSLHSNSGLAYGQWHNITYSQSGSTGSIYIDGRLVSQMCVTLQAKELAALFTNAYLGYSPYTDDATLAEAYIDNFRIYDNALSEAQTKTLYNKVKDNVAKIAPQLSEADSLEVANFLKKFNYLHATTELPTLTSEGIALTWTFNPLDGASAYVNFADGTLSVVSQPQADSESVLVGTLTVSFDEESGASLSTLVRIAPDDNRYGYLYCFMNSDDETTNYALGTKENLGRKFNVLLDGGEIFDTYNLAEIEHGTRDAYLGRGEGSDGYFITTTDMRQHTSGVWRNKGLNLLRSKDLIHWDGTTFNFTQGKAIFSDPQSTTDAYTTDDEYANINRVWAPQFIWDKDANNGQGAYLVYYSLLSSNTGDSYDRIYYSYTDSEFKTLTQPRVFFDPGISVIDADIVYNPYDSLYHMYYKREGATGAERGIYEATSPLLVGGTWTDILHVTNEGTQQVEGSSTVRRINEDTYNLYYMRYSGGSAYKYCQTDHLGLNPSSSAALQGMGAFQHGSVVTVTEDEYTLLQAWSDVTLYLPVVQAMKESSESTVFDAAISQATKALELTSVAELAQALPAAYEALKQAVEDYKQEICSSLQEGETADLSFLLVNPDFSDGTNGWTGTSFTASQGVAEAFNKTFNIYQILTNMPAGIYTLQAQGFYRNGPYASAYPAHQNGTEELLATLYLNNQSQTFMSLFDESAPYTYSPYTYPDDMTSANKAFNTTGVYTDNSVSYTLSETGDLTVGIAKTQAVTNDWTCFDNFKLLYTATSTAINPILPNGQSSRVDIYTLSGVKVRSNVTPSSDLKNLPKGIYLIGNQKVVVR